jgi:murein DD-endopeptidase MepM/ murein hydrolase activator NlpD
MNEPAVRPNNDCIKPNYPSTDDNLRRQEHTSQPTWFRAVEAVTAFLVIILPLSVHAGFFSDLFGTEVEAEDSSTPPAMVSAVDVALLTSALNPDPKGARGGAELVVEGDALVSTGPIGEDEIAEQGTPSGEIRVYTVRDGDTLSQVAEMFNVTTNTIMWANDLTRSTSIQPGDTLVILPIAGVRHEVKDGDTISTIAKKYEGDVEEILEFNQLESADELAVGDTLIIPGGALHSAPVRGSQAQPVRVSGNVAASAGFIHPAPGSVKTQGIHGYNAVDLAGSWGSGIRAAAGGEVIVAKSSGWNGGYGSYLVIRHPNGVQTLYAHLSSLNVGVGAYVSQGAVIGGMGSTGRSTGTHLHFEVRGARNPF